MQLRAHSLIAAAAIIFVATRPLAQIGTQDHPGQYSQQDIDVGLRVYTQQCAQCHGANGDQISGIDLRRAVFRRSLSDEDLARVITTGVAGLGMPPIALSPPELTGVIAYIRAGLDRTATAARVGLASRGRLIVEGKGGCLACHRIAGVGSRTAPDLSDIGLARSAGALQAALLDPSSVMMPINRPVRIVLRDGTTINGRRLNEDSGTVQIISDRERLLSLAKGDMRSFVVETKSTMPSFAEHLTPDEVADVVAYLLSLRGEYTAPAQLGAERIAGAAAEPHNWLTYSGGYFGQRYSLLTRIDPSNVNNLELKWMLPNQVAGAWQSTPLLVDGIMYVTQRPNDVLAVDAKTGRVFWVYRHTVSADARVCCGSNNRGVAILGDTLYMATLDARLIAIDARSGRAMWNVAVGDPRLGYSMTMAPLVVKDKVLVGVGGGEFGIRGFIAAFDAASGKEVWRFYTVPGPGEKGHETWETDAWETGGGSIWLTPSYDPALNLTYWGVGNPGPDWNPDQRPGDNLFTDSVVALDPDTGQLKWHFQFTPNDGCDYDSAQIGVLADLNWQGTPTKTILWANRNGFFYVLDRTNGKFLRGAPFVKVNWASGLDPSGRPIPTPQPEGAPTWPGNQGGTNWYSPSFSPRTELFYVSTWEEYATIYNKEFQEYEPGRRFNGGGFRVLTPVPGARAVGIGRSTPINNWTDAVGHGTVMALDPRTGEQKWRFEQFDVTESGILTTASDLLFTGGREGYFYALAARTGAVLWKVSLGGQIVNGPITYVVDGKQYVAVIAGHSLVTFALRD